MFTEEKTNPAIPSVLPPADMVKVSEPAAIGDYYFAPLDALRLAASLLLTFAVDDDVRGTLDPVYRTIVEGRTGPKYSSCGDLAHWLLFRMGVRAPFINRSEYHIADGGHGWRVGLNLNLLTPPGIGTNPVAHSCHKLTEMPDVQAGDVLLINNEYGGHAMCVSGRFDVDGLTTIVTAEYGQPGGAKKSHGLRFDATAGLLFITTQHGAYQVTSWISLPKALALPGTVAPDLRALTEAQRVVFGKTAKQAGATP